MSFYCVLQLAHDSLWNTSVSDQVSNKFNVSWWVIELSIRWTPHPVIVTIRDTRDDIGVLLYSYYTTITGWGVLLSYQVRSLEDIDTQ